MAELITRREGATGWIVFSNPARQNAITYEMWSGIADAVAQFERDGAVRVIALRGEGDEAFSSGADISEFERTRDSVDATASYNHMVESANSAVLNAAKPTLAYIRGICFGGGLGLALHCDIRVCSDDSVFSMPAAKLGLGYSYESTMRIAHVVGSACCAEITLTGRRYSAQEALQMRILNTVVPKAKLQRVAGEICVMISENAPLTMAAIKRALLEGYKDLAQRDMRAVQAMIDACFESEDYREGRTAFLQKRKPVFRGR